LRLRLELELGQTTLLLSKLPEEADDGEIKNKPWNSQTSGPPEQPSPPKVSFLKAMWLDLEDHLRRVLTNFVILTINIITLYLSDRVAHFFQLHGLAEKVMMTVHSLGILAAVVIFVIHSVNDTIQTSRAKRKISRCRRALHNTDSSKSSPNHPDSSS
jgi:hypothetical protein